MTSSQSIMDNEAEIKVQVWSSLQWHNVDIRLKENSFGCCPVIIWQKE
jgi:hypothetical protein